MFVRSLFVHGVLEGKFSTLELVHVSLKFIKLFSWFLSGNPISVKSESVVFCMAILR